jgi:hypothetical protein
MIMLRAVPVRVPALSSPMQSRHAAQVEQGVYLSFPTEAVGQERTAVCSPMGQVAWPVISATSSGSLKVWICRICFHVLKYLDSLSQHVNTILS